MTTKEFALGFSAAVLASALLGAGGYALHLDSVRTQRVHVACTEQGGIWLRTAEACVWSRR